MNRAEEAANREQNPLSKLAEGMRKRQPYTPVGKCLEAIGLQPRIMPIALGGSDDATDCLVIPVDELMRLEWLHMGGGFSPVNQNEENSSG